jgi:acetolactate synthase-1/3 small subunit
VARAVGCRRRRGRWLPLRQTIAALVENRAGVLVRVAGLCSRRGCNIESLTVGPAERPDLARMTIVLDGEPVQAEQMVRQLGKLVDVLRVQCLPEPALVARELALCKVRCPAERRPAVLQVAEVFRARVVDVAPTTLTLEATGDEDKITAMLAVMAEFGIAEVARTGRAALARGADALSWTPERQERQGQVRERRYG